MAESAWSSEEMMIVAASRLLDEDDVVFIGVGLPSKAVLLGRSLRAPDLVLVYESGTLDTAPAALPLSIGDGELARTATAVVSLPEMFNYWLQGGRIRTGFLAAAQIDRFANLNTTVIGDYGAPTVRLPGAGGAPEISSFCERTFVMIRQTRRAFVERVDFVSSAGFLGGGGERDRLRVPGTGPRAVITDLGILEPVGAGRELVLTAVHPGVDPETAVAATGWPLAVADDLRVTEPPTAEELAALRRLSARTSA